MQTFTPAKKARVRQLRSKGYTYREIQVAMNLRIPKSTLSYTCRNVVLPDHYTDKVAQINLENIHKARAIALRENRAQRSLYLQSLSKRNRYLLKRVDGDVKKLLLAMLYLGEGTKWKSHRGPILGSRDPEIIVLYLKLLKACYGVSTDRLRCRIGYRVDQDLNELQRYWSKITGIPLSQFYKTIPDPRTAGKPTSNRNYRGVCVIICSGTEIQLELAAIAKLLVKYLGP